MRNPKRRAASLTPRRALGRLVDETGRDLSLGAATLVSKHRRCAFAPHPPDPDVGRDEVEEVRMGWGGRRTAADRGKAGVDMGSASGESRAQARQVGWLCESASAGLVRLVCSCKEIGIVG